MTWRKETKKILNILRTLTREVFWSQPVRREVLTFSALSPAQHSDICSNPSCAQPIQPSWSTDRKIQYVYMFLYVYTHTHAHTSYHGLLLKVSNQILFRKPQNDQFVSRPLRNWHVIEYFIYFFLSCKNNYFNILGKVFCCCLGFCWMMPQDRIRFVLTLHSARYILLWAVGKYFLNLYILIKFFQIIIIQQMPVQFSLLSGFMRIHTIYETFNFSLGWPNI